MRKFLIMSDLHLVPPGSLSHGIDTAERLRQAIAHLGAHHSDAGFCILAGDLADAGRAEAYALLRSRLGEFPMPVYCTLGNHDHRATALDGLALTAETRTGRLDHALHLGDHLVLVFDTLAQDRIGGELTPAQLDWAADHLRAHGAGPVIVVVHHNLAPLGVPTDPVGLSNPDALVDLLTASGARVDMVISGHVHCTTAGSYRGLPFTSLSGNHYNLVPRYSGTLNDVPRREGPGQIAVLLAGPTGVVVHHESFWDMNPVQSPDLHFWPGDATGLR